MQLRLLQYSVNQINCWRPTTAVGDEHGHLNAIPDEIKQPNSIRKHDAQTMVPKARSKKKRKKRPMD